MKVGIFQIVFIFVAYHFCVSDQIVIEGRSNPFHKDYEVLKLLNDSQQSESGHEVANAIYQQKYGEKPVEISYISKVNGPFISHDNSFFIDHELAEDYLKAFGGSIKHITIAYNFIPPSKQRRISELVNIYCHATLESFHAKYCKFIPDALDNMRKPFPRVERVIFSGEWKELNKTSLGLGELFPKMRILNLSYEEGYIFYHNYPHLVELTADKPTTPDFKKLIENNPQIKKLRVQATSVEFLDVVNKKLPELEVFAFTVPNGFNQYTGPKFDFEKVTELLIRDSINGLNLKKFSFKQMNEFTIEAYNGISDEWIDFIGEHKQLEKLLISVGELNTTTLVELSKKTGNLVEAKIRCDIFVNSNNIAQFIQSNTKMEAVTLTSRRDPEIFTGSLVKALKEEWEVTTVDGTHFVYILTKLKPSAENQDQTEISTESTEAAETSTLNGIETTAPGGAPLTSTCTTLTVTSLVLILSIFSFF